MSNTRIIALAIAGAALLAAPAPASADTFISKQEARRYALKEVRQLANRVDWVTSYWIEHSPRCERIASSLIECDYELYDDIDDVTCSDAVQIRSRSARYYRVRFPYEADCR